MAKTDKPREGWGRAYDSHRYHFFVGEPDNRGRPVISLCEWFAFRRWAANSADNTPGAMDCAACRKAFEARP